LVKEIGMEHWKGKIITKQVPSGELVRLVVLEKEMKRGAEETAHGD